MSANNFFEMFLILAMMFIIVIIIKWINGDFTPVSIEKIDEQEFDLKDSDGKITGKKCIVVYKYTYKMSSNEKDNRIKIKTKTYIL